jgi:hypothetical protein
MTSDERHSFLEGIVGKDQAGDVNALFESKLLLKNQQAAMIGWAREAAGLKPSVRQDIISKINKLDTVLNPDTQDAFLHDLASKKLGTDVTLEEAQKISSLAKDAAAAKAQRDATPTDENILKYGKAKGAVGDYLDSVKPSPNRGWKNIATDIMNIPKSALTSVLHFSAMGVQGWGMVSTPEFWSAAVDQFKYFASEENYKNAEAMISGHPDYDIARRAGLGITSIDGKLNDREEAIQSSLLQKASKWVSNKTGAPDIIRASSRAFTGFLNTLRFDRFEKLLTAARLRGEDIQSGSKPTEDIAHIVNSFTGRGDLPFGLDKAQSAMNTIFFSPRKMMGAVDMFNPWTYLDPKASPTAKIAAFRQLTGSLIVTGAMLTAAKLAGASIETDPRGTNFGKAKIGNTTIDMTGGNASYVRLLARIITNKSKSSTGKVTTLGTPITTTTKTGKTEVLPFTPSTRESEVQDYIRNHTAPVVSALWDWAAGSNSVGQPVTLKSEAFSTLTPLVTQAFVDMYENDPKTFREVWPMLPSIFGYSTESTAPIMPKAKK